MVCNFQYVCVFSNSLLCPTVSARIPLYSRYIDMCCNSCLQVYDSVCHNTVSGVFSACFVHKCGPIQRSVQLAFHFLFIGHFSYLSGCIGRIEADIRPGNKIDSLMCPNVISTSLLVEKRRYSMNPLPKAFVYYEYTVCKDFQVIQFDIGLFTFNLNR